MGYDDSLDAFGIHGTGGIVGALLLVPFIRNRWMADAAQINGGSWTSLDQLWVQTFAVLVTIAYSVVVSIVLYFIVKYTVGFRLKDEEEVKGLDKSQHGEHGYGLLDIQ